MARICVIRQGYLSLDPRVRAEVEALLMAGHQVDVICQRLSGEPRFQRDGRLTIRRLSISHDRRGWGSYLTHYSAFLTIAAFLVTMRHVRRPYDVVQVNTIPDALVFAALLPRLLSARVLLDLHECMPEFVATKFNVRPDHALVRLVARVEQAAIRFADFAITCTEPMRRTFIARGAPPGKIAVVVGSFGLSLGDGAVRAVASDAAGPFVLICHGTIEERYGLDTIVQAVALLKEEIPDLFLAIYGDGSYLEAVRSLVRQLDLEQRVSFSNGWVSMEELVTAIRAADAGVVAMKRDAFRDLTLCNKMFDFIGLSKPAIVSRTRSVEEYFDDSCFRMFTAGDADDLARAIREVYRDAGLRRRLVARAAQVAERYSWSGQRTRYLQIVDALVQGRPQAALLEPTRQAEEPQGVWP